MLVQIGSQIERCTLKPFGRPEDYPERMLWCKVHNRSGAVIRKLVIPAAVMAHPVTFRAVRYEVIAS
jgi:hypothetical protein